MYGGVLGQLGRSAGLKCMNIKYIGIWSNVTATVHR